MIVILFISFAIRFYKISDVPPGLYIDEVSIGYNAFRVLTTGKDEFGVSYPLFFKSFGDYKMPVYIYATSLSMSVFGKNEFAVRFPSAFLGSLTVLLFYLFIKKVLQLDASKLKENRETIALLSAFLLAITPWQLQFSRGGFENNAALFIFMLAFTLALYFFERKRIALFIISMFLFALSIYTYHTYRIFAPLTVGIISAFSIYRYPRQRRKIILGALVFLILATPIFLFSLSSQGSSRFAATSAFTELGKIDNNQKIFLYPLTIIKNYLSFFSFYFLFDTGDGIGRHQIPNFGPLFKWQLPFLLIGIYSLIKLKSKFFKPLILILLFIAPMPASLVVPSPQTLRPLLIVIPLIALISLGVINFNTYIRRARFGKHLLFLLVLIAFFELLFYLHYYYVHYPQVNQLDWGSGYKETVLRTEEMRTKFDEVIVDKNLTFFSIYYKFYTNKQVPREVGVEWLKPADWKNKKVLYVRPYYGSNYNPQIISNVYLSNDPNYIFAQFWSL